MELLKTRRELVDKYFDGSQVYEEGNMGLVTLLSDLQHMYTSGKGKQSVYWNTILNDIKSILIEDSQIKKKSDKKSIEERIDDNIKYQTTAEHLKHKPLEQIKKEAEIIGIAGYISEYIQWDPDKAIEIANDLLEDVNLHNYRVVNLDEYETNKKENANPLQDDKPEKKRFLVKDSNGKIVGEIRDAINEYEDLWFGHVKLYSMPENAEYGYFTLSEYKDAELYLKEVKSNK